MSATAAPKETKEDQILSLAQGLVENQQKFGERIEALEAKVEKAESTPVYGTVGAIPRDSEGYSVLKMAAYSAGMTMDSPPKYELDVHEKLWKIYKGLGWTTTPHQNCRNFLVPYSTAMIPRNTSEGERLYGELKCKMVANADQVDPEEARWLQKKLGRMVTKDLGTVNDNAGGVLVGFPTLGELIDMQRNIEVFNQAGATEQQLPPNGRIQFPKLTNSTTAYWVGEGNSITESQPVTGYLDLQAKKLGTYVDLNNELVRFATVTSEALVRTDMAKVAALKMDLAQLEGTGGTQIKGLITYPSAATWTSGTDPLLAYTVTSNLFQINDAAEMEALMPDTAGEPTAWLMRRNMWAKIRNRRTSAASSADNAGPYLASITRSLQERQGYELDGTKVVRSSQISNTRDNGSRTYIILGYFPDWITARFGVLEFLSSQVGDTQMTNDQTRIRCIQHVDAGPRHASSFVLADAITIS